MAPNAAFARRAIVPAVLVLLLALGLRLFHLGDASLWIDELFSLRDAEAITPFNRMRPVYYLFLRGWMLFGQSEAWLRLPSVLFGAAAVAVLLQLGTELADRATGIVAALLLAISPMAVDHSQQVRMYMLGALLGLMGCLALSRALDQNRPSFWAWGLCRLLMLATAPLNGALLLADALIVWRHARAKPEILKKFARTALLPLVWLPVLGFVYLQPATEEPTAWLRQVPRPDLPQILAQVVAFAVNWPTGADAMASPYPSALVARAYDALGLLLLGLLVLAMDDREFPRFGRATIWACVPLLALVAASQASRSLWVERYLVFAAPYVLLLVAAGLVRALRIRAALAWLAGAAVLVGAAGGLRQYYWDLQREDWRGAIAAISDRERPDDVVAIPQGYCGSALQHYHPAPIASVPVGIATFAATESEVREALRQLPRGRRLWLVYRRVSVPGQQEAFRRAVSEELNVEWQQAFAGIDLFLVTPSRAPS